MPQQDRNQRVYTRVDQRCYYRASGDTRAPDWSQLMATNTASPVNMHADTCAVGCSGDPHCTGGNEGGGGAKADEGQAWAWDYVQSALAGRTHVEDDFADGRNPYARPNPELPWVARSLPFRAEGERVWLGHEPTFHDFPIADAGRARVKRRPSLLGTEARPQALAS